jgi:hypothetical protein
LPLDHIELDLLHRCTGRVTYLRCLLPECRPQQVLCGAAPLTRDIQQTSGHAAVTFSSPRVQTDSDRPKLASAAHAMRGKQECAHSRRRLGKRLGKRLWAGVCTRLGKRLGTCHGSKRHLPSGQATGVCHGVCCKAPAIAPAMQAQAQAHAMQAPAHAMQAPAHAMGHMPCNRTTRGKMV